MNKTMIQFFHWYFPEDGSLWKQFKESCAFFSAQGITHVWLPPATKAHSGTSSVGYDSYDLYDLGEFNQKGAIRTKYGTKEEYLDAIKEARKHGISVLADAVLNHKAGADENEVVLAVKVKETNRNQVISEPAEIEAATRFTFDGRGGKYSAFVWDRTCFTGVDWDARKRQRAIFLFRNIYGNTWEEVIGKENGNYDYLMLSDIEFRNPWVREELKRWGEWQINEIGVDGFRLDAIKHITPSFFVEWLKHLNEKSSKPLFAVGEYWSGDNRLLGQYTKATRKCMRLFDVPLHYRFFHASREKGKFDLRTIFSNTFTSTHPSLSVSFVDNHDTQPFQALLSYVDFWFKPLAYALILLRKEGIPCLFYPDLYGASYTENFKGKEVSVELKKVQELPILLECRKERAYGRQREYLDEAHCIGWTREGTNKWPFSGLAVVVSNKGTGSKRMEVGARHKGKVFFDVLGNVKKEVVIDSQGYGVFLCKANSVSVWIVKS